MIVWRGEDFCGQEPEGNEVEDENSNRMDSLQGPGFVYAREQSAGGPVSKGGLGLRDGACQRRAPQVEKSRGWKGGVPCEAAIALGVERQPSTTIVDNKRPSGEASYFVKNSKNRLFDRASWDRFATLPATDEASVSATLLRILRVGYTGRIRRGGQRDVVDFVRRLRSLTQRFCHPNLRVVVNCVANTARKIVAWLMAGGGVKLTTQPGALLTGETGDAISAAESCRPDTTTRWVHLLPSDIARDHLKRLTIEYDIGFRRAGEERYCKLPKLLVVKRATGPSTGKKTSDIGQATPRTDSHYPTTIMRRDGTNWCCLTVCQALGEFGGFREAFRRQRTGLDVLGGHAAGVSVRPRSHPGTPQSPPPSIGLPNLDPHLRQGNMTLGVAIVGGNGMAPSCDYTVPQHPTSSGSGGGPIYMVAGGNGIGGGGHNLNNNINNNAGLGNGSTSSTATMASLLHHQQQQQQGPQRVGSCAAVATPPAGVGYAFSGGDVRNSSSSLDSGRGSSSSGSESSSFTSATGHSGNSSSSSSNNNSGNNNNNNNNNKVCIRREAGSLAASGSRAHRAPRVAVKSCGGNAPWSSLSTDDYTWARERRVGQPPENGGR
ncbi:hypothetical protein BIW11_14157 [Tropilaelaps mercedesae]|uniref:Uncharacterized protein n=1 Tax=Tropilaelaps mercedesae TaxID=418985 RepID=A0A1V9WYT7_9ACAR|nr:hypothetical protein BIW11_14157 [Tropilaelaps mercedesae]